MNEERQDVDIRTDIHAGDDDGTGMLGGGGFVGSGMMGGGGFTTNGGAVGTGH